MTSASAATPFPVAEQRVKHPRVAERFVSAVHSVVERGPQHASKLEDARRAFVPVIPELLRGKVEKKVATEKTTCVDNADAIAAKFPHIYGSAIIDLRAAANAGDELDALGPGLRIGCVLSGGQAAGGHNCIIGLFDYLQDRHPGSTLFGFLGGPKGVMQNTYKLLDKAVIDRYRNSGGFTMLASGRDKIETEDQFKMAVRTATNNRLDGLVVIGGDDSNTNACLLAERFAADKLATRVIGLPKTIDGDLKNVHCETSFGFDTAAKLYGELTGNIMVDCMSSRKYYHFVRLMGREASHLTLEVALATQPNLVFIGEEVKRERQTLHQIANNIADLVVERAAAGMEFGVVLIPEGLIDFIPEVGALIAELNEMLARRDADSNCYEGLTEDWVSEQLSAASRNVFQLLPAAIREQLLLDRDPHGNVQVAKIESERLLGELVTLELEVRLLSGSYAARFAVQYHYFGYEGRCPPPTNFDANYCYGLGRTAAALIAVGATGMMACLQQLTRHPTEWLAKGVPLTAMLAIERRKGKDKPVIRKALVELSGKPFAALQQRRHRWRLASAFANPGPVQFDGATANEVTHTLRLEQGLAVPEQLASPLVVERRADAPEVPDVLRGPALQIVSGAVPSAAADDLFVAQQLPHTTSLPRLEIAPGHAEAESDARAASGTALRVANGMRVGVVFCGRQCPGAHNVVAGISRFLLERSGTEAKLFGFVDGTHGLFAARARELTQADLHPFLNGGGMDLLGRSADVIRSAEHHEKAEAVCVEYRLDGLVLVGGPVTNSDTALLAEAFTARGVATRVIGVPATIDGDLYSNSVEASIGFDTASRVYASLVGNLATDAASARKYWYFVRMMGRSPSHITLECANLTQPNLALIGEEIEARRMTLAEIVSEIADVVAERASAGNHFGVCLIPEGLIEFIPQVNALLKDISSARRLVELRLPNGRGAIRDGAAPSSMVARITALLSPYSAALLHSMPTFIQRQLLLETQASDDKAQFNQIETERLLAELVRLELKRRRDDAQLSAEWCAPDPKFAPVCFYLGYQARSSMPSRFDSELAFALGQAAVALIAAKATAYMATAHCLASPTAEWRLCGVPLYSMMAAERRAGQAVAVIRPSQVSLYSPSFKRWALIRDHCKQTDTYCNPGPMQLSGPLAFGPSPGRLLAEHVDRGPSLAEVADICREVSSACWPGCHADVLKTALASLRALQANLHVLAERDAMAATGSFSTHASTTKMSGEQLARMTDN